MDNIGRPTVEALRRSLVSRLSSAWGDPGAGGTDALDVRILLAHALEIDPSALTLHNDDLVPATVETTVSAMIARRMKGEPVARIVGEKEFWSLPFRLSRGTLVPRPDTETMVSVALERIDAAGRRSDPLRLLDLGTGSGCILLATLSELPAATGLGVDCDEDAVATAQENAERLGLAGRAQMILGNWADGIDGAFDVILANPPYVEEEALPELPIEVIGYDPRTALSGGPSGLDGYREIIPALPRLMAPSGFALLEFGPRQAAPIAEMAASAGMMMEIRHDLAGRERAALLTFS